LWLQTEAAKNTLSIVISAEGASRLHGKAWYMQQKEEFPI
jgi:hypothetical protein